MEIKNKMRYHFAPIRMATIKTNKNQKITIVGKDAEKMEPLCTTGENVKWYSPCGKLVWRFLKKLEIGLLWWHSG